MSNLELSVGNGVLKKVFSRLERDQEIRAQQRRGGPMIDAGSWTLRLRHHRDINSASLVFNDGLGMANFYEPYGESEPSSLMYVGEQGCLGAQILVLKHMGSPLAQRLLERPFHTGVVEAHSKDIAAELRVAPDAFSSIRRTIEIPHAELGQSYDFIKGLITHADWYRRRQNYSVPSYPTLVSP